ncbi:MAG: zinc dependent phospholipase C family protein [Deltaproteobacteria bacterium]|nr:zinc dependent phospholipase C family protein [Deltaproteobacteria bacterium]
MLSVVIITALLFFLFPTAAHAWGPGMHVETAMRVLADLSFVLPAIAALISKHPEDYIYGTTSPDIILGKKYAGLQFHCHNWEMGNLILSEASSDRQRAAAYGYLTHLAMDVVAHNFFIPYKIVRSYKTRLLSHSYWEMRFDLDVPDRCWKHLGKISVHEIEEFDELLKRVLKKTLFSFSTNKRIFNSILMLQKMRGMKETLRLYAKQSKWELEQDNRRQYVDLTWDAVKDFLSRPDEALCLRADPAGIKRLDYAQNLRRELKAMVKRGFIDEPQAEKLLHLVRSGLLAGLYDPDVVLPDVIDVM